MPSELITSFEPFSSSPPPPDPEAANPAVLPATPGPDAILQTWGDDAITRVGELAGYDLRPGQISALQELSSGQDSILVARTGYGKTLVMMGYHFMCQPDIRPLTLILSPLKAIENGQAREAAEQFGKHGLIPFVLDVGWLRLGLEFWPRLSGFSTLNYTTPRQK